jgi:DNA-3-methyladenine glycosylase
MADAMVATPGSRGDVLAASFFNRPAAHVARDLLGKAVMRKRGISLTSSIIVETEAYEGRHDLACHSARGRTARTEVMFGPPRYLYVYRVYGLHWMLNVVTGGVDDAAAVLICGVNQVTGPGRVAAALGIEGSLNARDARPSTGLWFEDAGQKIPRSRITRTPRIGVDYAGPIWSAKRLRFVLRVACSAPK